jgi:hypothetical protein
MKNYCGSHLRRCAVLEILMYYLYIPVSAFRAPCIWLSSLRFSTACQRAAVASPSSQHINLRMD